jgi:hypothetical protein
MSEGEILEDCPGLEKEDFPGGLQVCGSDDRQSLGRMKDSG